MKKLFLFATLFAIAFGLKAQVPVEQTVEFNKQNVQGVVLTVDGYDIEVVKDALQNRFEKTAMLKGKKAKGGFYAYLSQQFAEFSTKNLDIYTLVDFDGKRKNGQIAISILVSTGNENFISSTGDPETVNNVKHFLTAFNTYLKEYDTNKKIAEQKGVLNDLVKESDKMNADLEKWRKSISDLEAQSLKREKELEAKTAEIEKTRTKIMELSNILQMIPGAQGETIPAME